MWVLLLLVIDSLSSQAQVVMNGNGVLDIRKYDMGIS